MGRYYVSTAYLHEQGNDIAKGLLLRAEGKPIGKKGFYWLMVNLATNYGGDAGREDGLKTDKISLQDRYNWAKNNSSLLISFAENPFVNTGWMYTDKCWQFLASCFELKNLRDYQKNITEFQDPYGYISNFVCFVDGSTNGSQHLVALTKDDSCAHLVNLVPLEVPGDLYSYVAVHVWNKLSAIISGMLIEDLLACEEYIDKLIDIKQRLILEERGSPNRKIIIEEIQTFKLDNQALVEMTSPVFWSRITDLKERRKVIKRGVMTLVYGSTRYGMSQQVIDDADKHNIDLLLFLEHKWGSYLGGEIFCNCRDYLKKPMQLLAIFEKAGEKAERRGEFLSWTVPITLFPVVQNYTKGKVKKIYVQYWPPGGEKSTTGYWDNTLQLNIAFIEDTVPAKGKQSQGVSPNVIHSLDAAHLMITVNKANFPVTTVHDSFGCLFADMPELFNIVRESFLELYMSNPLESIIQQIGGDLSDIEIGTLDLELILRSDYCFS